MKGFDRVEKAHKEAIEYIRFMLKDPELGDFINWMMNTEENPYSYLPEGWASATYTSTGFSSLVHVINHAWYDDGDISFVTVKGQPRIAFAHPTDEWFEKECLSSSERDYLDISNISILEVLPSAFGPLCEQHSEKRAKESKEMETRRNELLNKMVNT